MRIDRLMHGLARIMALAGGAVLVILTVLTCVSIIGRSISTVGYSHYIRDNLAWFTELVRSSGIGPVPGDFELLEAGVAFAVFAFLPWCQVTRGHAVVDLFAALLPQKANRLIDLLSETLLASVITLIAWRHLIATGEKMRNGETTFILQFPVWWAWAASAFAVAVAAVIAIWMVSVRLRELGGRHVSVSGGGGPVH